MAQINMCACGSSAGCARCAGTCKCTKCWHHGTRPSCVNHPDRPSHTNLDDEELCWECADNWVRGEGIASLED